ncbi:hypothetical protein [Pseudolysinimonas sp.]|uniref:hypothetical protein n=1 Tax=Pseudolysinimonas sp. TaxID=2680009 RepID=UPI0037CA644B
MANPLRKTMVYLGLADEDYEDVMPSAPAAPVSRAEAGTRAPVTPLRRPAYTNAIRDFLLSLPTESK